MNHFYDTFRTPLGDFSIAMDETGAVVVTAFGDLARLQSRFAAFHVIREKTLLQVARDQVRAYFAGETRRFDLRLAAPGTLFQQRVRAALTAIPFGATRSYGELARDLRSSPRAIGRANTTNPICLIVPCHRVIGADGSLTGFAFGEDLKRRLLAHELVPAFCAA